MNLINLDWTTLAIGLTVITTLGLFVVFHKSNSRARAEALLSSQEKN